MARQGLVRHGRHGAARYGEVVQVSQPRKALKGFRAAGTLAALFVAAEQGPDRAARNTKVSIRGHRVVVFCEPKDYACKGFVEDRLVPYVQARLGSKFVRRW